MNDELESKSVSLPPKPVWFAAVVAVLAWPLGKLVAAAMSVGSDGPGMQLAALFGTLVMIIVWVAAFLSITAMCWGKMAGFEARARLAIVASVLLVPGVLIVSAIPGQDYTLRVSNDSGADVSSVVVSFNDSEFSYGYLAKGIYAVRHYVTTPPEGVATVRWNDDNGLPREAELDVSSTVSGRYQNGVLTFSFEENGKVTAGFFVQKSR